MSVGPITESEGGVDQSPLARRYPDKKPGQQVQCTSAPAWFDCVRRCHDGTGNAHEIGRWEGFVPLVSSLPMVQAALQRSRAVLAFNVSALEMAQGVIAAAQALNRPVIIQCNRAGLTHIGGGDAGTSSPAQAQMGIPIAAATLITLAHQASVGVALHLDHAGGLDELATAIATGFTSLMLDGSTLGLDDHINLARRAHDMAAAARVPLEAELGHVSGDEAGVTIARASLTDPLEAAAFVGATHIEMLAVSIGNVHGRAPKDARLDLDRLQQIHAAVAIPLVLHGASGIAPDQIDGAVARGIAKINIGSGVQRAFATGLARGLETAGASSTTASAAAAAEALAAGRLAVEEFAHAALAASHVMDAAAV